ncbi:MAG TPA: HAD-IA family hydrolase [Blastocatellia bacterium]|nr:HAD-IA family hydrolase [Blastocatellia bacterium]
MKGGDLPETGSEIRVVFFDATGTLLRVRGSVGEIYSELARRSGVETEPERIQSGFTRAFGAQPPLAFPIGTPEPELGRLEFEWWRRLVSQVFAGYDFPRFDEFFAEVFDYFGGREAWEVYDDVVPALKALKARGLRLAVLSNFDRRLERLLRELELDGYFDAIYISSRMGAAKPDPLIFREALARQQLRPSQALHIGDSRREDFEGAAAAGIKPILIERSLERSGAA